VALVPCSGLYQQHIVVQLCALVDLHAPSYPRRDQISLRDDDVTYSSSASPAAAAAAAAAAATVN